MASDSNMAFEPSGAHTGYTVRVVALDAVAIQRPPQSMRYWPLTAITYSCLLACLEFITKELPKKES